MNPHQEFWSDFETEIGHLEVELGRISTQLDEIEKNLLVRHFVHLEFYSHRQTLIEKVNAIEKSILDLQQWVSTHGNPTGSQ